MRLDRIVAERQMPPMPLDQAQRNTDNREGSHGGPDLGGSHQLHLDGSG